MIARQNVLIGRCPVEGARRQRPLEPGAGVHIDLGIHPGQIRLFAAGEEIAIRIGMKNQHHQGIQGRHLPPALAIGLPGSGGGEHRGQCIRSDFDRHQLLEVIEHPGFGYHRHAVEADQLLLHHHPVVVDGEGEHAADPEQHRQGQQPEIARNEGEIFLRASEGQHTLGPAQYPAVCPARQAWPHRKARSMPPALQGGRLFSRPCSSTIQADFRRN
ncbi:hypothetical protein D3C75_788020 [compost metagenome]